LNPPTPEKNNGREDERGACAAALLVLRLARFLKRSVDIPCVKYEGEDKAWQARFYPHHKTQAKERHGQTANKPEAKETTRER
jgi:hypothetical protein